MPTGERRSSREAISRLRHMFGSIRMVTIVSFGRSSAQNETRKNRLILIFGADTATPIDLPFVFWQGSQRCGEDSCSANPARHHNDRILTFASGMKKSNQGQTARRSADLNLQIFRLLPASPRKEFSVTYIFPVLTPKGPDLMPI